MTKAQTNEPMIFMENKERYLTLDAEHPLVCTDRVYDEMILYNLAEEDRGLLFSDFSRLTGKKIDEESSLTALSGGQKVILMVLLALYSPARAIRFENLSHNLDAEKDRALRSLIAASDKDILLGDPS